MPLWYPVMGEQCHHRSPAFFYFSNMPGSPWSLWACIFFSRGWLKFFCWVIASLYPKFWTAGSKTNNGLPTIFFTTFYRPPLHLFTSFAISSTDEVIFVFCAPISKYPLLCSTLASLNPVLRENSTSQQNKVDWVHWPLTPLWFDGGNCNAQENLLTSAVGA